MLPGENAFHVTLAYLPRRSMLWSCFCTAFALEGPAIEA